VNEHIDFIKIDVDGREIEVLEGAIKLINRFRPHIMIEIARENEEYFGSFLTGLTAGFVITSIEDRTKITLFNRGSSHLRGLDVA